MTRLSLIVPAAALLMLSIACNQTASNTEARDYTSTSATGSKDVAATADSVATASPGAFDKEDRQNTPAPDGNGHTNTVAKQPAPPVNPDWDKKIVKTGDLNVEAKNFQTFTRRLHNTIKEMGGYIAQEQQTQSPSSIENSVSIKVPVDRFEDMVVQLVSDSDRLIEKKINTDDVTGKIVDTKSRMETKRQVKERYVELLKQTHNREDILNTQKEIDGLQEELDAAAGQVAYLGHAAALSTINLHFFQVLDASVKDDTNPTFFKRLRDSVSEGWSWCSSLVLGLISVWPLWLAAGLGLYAFRKKIFGANKKAPSAGN